jgi:hypothetical protein
MSAGPLLASSALAGTNTYTSGKRPAIAALSGANVATGPLLVPSTLSGANVSARPSLAPSALAGSNTTARNRAALPGQVAASSHALPDAVALTE